MTDLMGMNGLGLRHVSAFQLPEFIGLSLFLPCTTTATPSALLKFLSNRETGNFVYGKTKFSIKGKCNNCDVC